MAAPRYRGDDGVKPNFAFDANMDDGEKKMDGAAGQKQRPLMTRILHSFKRQENLPRGIDEEGGVPRPGDTSTLHRKLKGRHLQMISVGGAIGAGLFIGSGKALATGGP